MAWCSWFSPSLLTLVVIVAARELLAAETRIELLAVFSPPTWRYGYLKPTMGRPKRAPPHRKGDLENVRWEISAAVGKEGTLPI